MEAILFNRLADESDVGGVRKLSRQSRGVRDFDLGGLYRRSARKAGQCAAKQN